MASRRRSTSRLPSPLFANLRNDPSEHNIFIATCEIVIAEGHRRGKCFSTKGWQRICELFNSKARNEWTNSQLKNYWTKLQKKHKLLFYLLRCTGIEYRSGTGIIVAPEHWWESKIKENWEYAKYKNIDCSEIYDMYGKLFNDMGNSTKYALSPSKLSQRGFDLGIDSDREDRGDKLPINTEGTDSSDSPVGDRGQSSMHITGRHGGDKRKCTDFTSIARSHQKNDMSIDECASELLFSGHVDEGSPLHLFTLWFLRVKENWNLYRATKTPYPRFKFIEYCFDCDNQSSTCKA